MQVNLAKKPFRTTNKKKSPQQIATGIFYYAILN